MLDCSIWLHLALFWKRPILHRMCASCSELPSCISTMVEIVIIVIIYIYIEREREREREGEALFILVCVYVAERAAFCS